MSMAFPFYAADIYAQASTQIAYHRRKLARLESEPIPTILDPDAEWQQETRRYIHEDAIRRLKAIKAGLGQLDPGYSIDLDVDEVLFLGFGNNPDE